MKLPRRDRCECSSDRPMLKPEAERSISELDMDYSLVSSIGITTGVQAVSRKEKALRGHHKQRETNERH